ncbi:Murein DD-endopeptidase MepM [Agromyces sp. NDB4Y10]|nr:Murein DD-endopeptidase MepM [Agromyces sp. NDB4Y10]
MLVGDGPVARMATTDTSADAEVTALLGLRTQLERAQADLREAEAALDAGRTTQQVARTTAERLDERAAEARGVAERAAAAYLAASRGDGAAITSVDAAFKAGNDLLAGLGGLERVQQLSGDVDRLREIAERREADAVKAEERAAAAWLAVEAVPIDDLQAAVDAARAAVTAARADLRGLQSRVAAETVAIVDTLPQDVGQLSEQGWANPATGTISDVFGPRPVKPVPGVNEFHRGTDIAAQCGAGIYAATGGTVTSAGPNGTYGNWILIDHGAGISTGYAHIREGGILVDPGQEVAAGELIAVVGSTGASTGCHLHFEVRIDGTAVDAVPFMAARGVKLG